MVQPLSETPGFTPVSPSIIQQENPEAAPEVTKTPTANTTPQEKKVQDVSEAAAVEAEQSQNAPAAASDVKPSTPQTDFFAQLGTVLANLLGGQDEVPDAQVQKDEAQQKLPLTDQRESTQASPQAKAEVPETNVPEIKGYKSTLKAAIETDTPIAHTDIRGTGNYILEAAKKRGIDPKTALRVAESEGLQKGVWQSNWKKNGKREPSYGPFQLLVGGGGTGFPEGLGNQFKKDTGKDPSDPKNILATIDYALDEVKKRGWSQWYGAKRVGISRWQGIL